MQVTHINHDVFTRRALSRAIVANSLPVLSADARTACQNSTVVRAESKESAPGVNELLMQLSCGKRRPLEGLCCGRIAWLCATRIALDVDKQSGSFDASCDSTISCGGLDG